jgi:hypothetical protein
MPVWLCCWELGSTCSTKRRSQLVLAPGCWSGWPTLCTCLPLFWSALVPVVCIFKNIFVVDFAVENLDQRVQPSEGVNPSRPSSYQECYCLLTNVVYLPTIVLNRISTRNIIVCTVYMFDLVGNLDQSVLPSAGVNPLSSPLLSSVLLSLPTCVYLQYLPLL